MSCTYEFSKFMNEIALKIYNEIYDERAHCEENYINLWNTSMEYLKLQIPIESPSEEPQGSSQR